MPHQHQAFLDELKIAIDKLVPLTPPEVVKEAEDLYRELLENDDTTKKQIHRAVTVIGRKEYPYRKAYLEICASDEEERLREVVLDRLDKSVKKKVENIIEHGVLIDDLVKSRLFEDKFSAKERYQVEQAILLSEDVLDTQCDDRARNREQEFETLVEKWKKQIEHLQGLIDRLRGMADEDPKWTAEINGVADKLEEGWSLVERDPTEEEIVKEIEYWNTVLHEEEGE